jgi:hypothetical protein
VTTVKTVLLLFRPFCTCSCTRGSNQKHSSHGAPLLPLALLLLELYNNIILMLQKERNCWPLVLDILDDCKCSENFLAQTITTAIRLSTTILIQIVDCLHDDCVVSYCSLRLQWISVFHCDAAAGWPASGPGCAAAAAPARASAGDRVAAS